QVRNIHLPYEVRTASGREKRIGDLRLGRGGTRGVVNVVTKSQVRKPLHLRHRGLAIYLTHQAIGFISGTVGRIVERVGDQDETSGSDAGCRAGRDERGKAAVTPTLIQLHGVRAGEAHGVGTCGAGDASDLADGSYGVAGSLAG